MDVYVRASVVLTLKGREGGDKERASKAPTGVGLCVEACECKGTSHGDAYGKEGMEASVLAAFGLQAGNVRESGASQARHCITRRVKQRCAPAGWVVKCRREHEYKHHKHAA